MRHFDVTAPPFNATGTGAAPDTRAIQRAINAAYAVGGGEVYFPPGRYLLDRRGDAPGASGGYALRVPSNVSLVGHGPHSILLNGGMRPGESAAERATWYDAVECVDGTVNVRVERLRFVGQNAPFTPYSNRQMSCVGVRGTRCADIAVRDCTFDDQFGFTVHNEGTSQRVHVVDCLMRQCANGLNVNGEYSVQARNTLYRTESIEAGGGFSTITNNVFQAPHGSAAISVGGTTARGDRRHGTVVSGNVIADADGAGISINDGSHDVIVADNVIARSRRWGIIVVTSGDNPVARVKVRGNAILDAGRRESAVSERCGIYVGGTTDGEVTGNTVEFGSTPGYDTAYGLLVSGAAYPSAGLMIAGNRLRGSFYSLSVERATDVFVGPDNLFPPGSFAAPDTAFRRGSARPG